MKRKSPRFLMPEGGVLNGTSEMRVGEALALNCGDVDLKRALLTIRLAKGDKSRIVPLHSSTVVALRHYASVRDGVYPALFALFAQAYRYECKKIPLI